MQRSEEGVIMVTHKFSAAKLHEFIVVNDTRPNMRNVICKTGTQIAVSGMAPRTKEERHKTLPMWAVIFHTVLVSLESYIPYVTILPVISRKSPREPRNDRGLLLACLSVYVRQWSTEYLYSYHPI